MWQSRFSTGTYGRTASTLSVRVGSHVKNEGGEIFLVHRVWIWKLRVFENEIIAGIHREKSSLLQPIHFWFRLRNVAFKNFHHLWWNDESSDCTSRIKWSNWRRHVRVNHWMGSDAKLFRVKPSVARRHSHNIQPTAVWLHLQVRWRDHQTDGVCIDTWEGFLQCKENKFQEFSEVKFKFLIAGRFR